MTEPTKICAPCGQRKPWSAFYATSTGSPRTYCKDCDKALARERQRANPEQHAKRQAATHRRRMADPERAAVRREHDRSRKRRLYGFSPRAGRMRRPPERGSIHAGPFAAWLQALGLPLATVAAHADIEERILRRIVNREQANVSIDTVDRVLLATGGLIELFDLYPVAA